MFTGIVEMTGTVKSLSRAGAGGTVKIEPAGKLELKIGGSVAVDGVCLTVANCDGRAFTADISEETTLRTTFPRMRTGQKVNIERPVSAGGRLDGHIVQGHIDCIGRVKSIIKKANYADIAVEFPAEFSRWTVEKGSIAIDGVSLTIARKSARSVTVAIIPETLTRTTLALKKPGDEVNIEFDIIGKYVENFARLK